MLRGLIIFLMKAVALSFALAVVAGISFFTIHWIRRPVPGSPEDLLSHADEMAWNNDWSGAAPLYAKAEALFRARGDAFHSLYAQVSRVPVLMETTSLPSLIAELNRDLKLPTASDPALRLRILEGEGALRRRIRCRPRREHVCSGTIPGIRPAQALSCIQSKR